MILLNINDTYYEENKFSFTLLYQKAHALSLCCLLSMLAEYLKLQTNIIYRSIAMLTITNFIYPSVLVILQIRRPP